MEDIHAIKPLITASIWDTHIPVVFLLFALFAFGYGILKIRQTFRHASIVTPIPEVPKETSADIVARALLLLETKRSMVHTMDFHNLYLQLTEIIKDCVSDVYQVPISNMTTKEIRATFGLPSMVQGLLIDFLQDIDRLKFSATHSDQQKAEEVYSIATQVLKTIQHTCTTAEGGTPSTV